MLFIKELIFRGPKLQHGHFHTETTTAHSQRRCRKATAKSTGPKSVGLSGNLDSTAAPLCEFGELLNPARVSFLTHTKGT